MRRKLILALLLCLILVLPAVAFPFPGAGAGIWPPAVPFGVTMRSVVDGRQGLAEAVDAGAKWIRVKMSWSMIESVQSDPPTYDPAGWAFYDRSFRNAAKNGMHVVVTVRDNPTWYGHPDVPAENAHCGPLADPNVLARFMREAVRRYKGPEYNVKVWELYNEPDNTVVTGRFKNLGGCWGNYGKQYADMLKVVYPAIKAEDPEAVVLIGGLGYEYSPQDGITHLNMGFLNDVLRNNGAPYFDAMNYHYFDNYATRWDA